MVTLGSHEEEQAPPPDLTSLGEATRSGEQRSSARDTVSLGALGVRALLQGPQAWWLGSGWPGSHPGPWLPTTTSFLHPPRDPPSLGGHQWDWKRTLVTSSV